MDSPAVTASELPVAGGVEALTSWADPAWAAPTTVAVASVDSSEQTASSLVSAVNPVPTAVNPGIPTTSQVNTSFPLLFSTNILESFTFSAVSSTTSSEPTSAISSSSSSAEPYQPSEDSSSLKHRGTSWPSNILAPVIGILGALLLLSIIARFYSLCTRRSMRKERKNLLGDDEFDDPEPPDSLTKVPIQSTLRGASTDGRNFHHADNFLPHSNCGHGASDSSHVEMGYKEEELLGNVPSSRANTLHTKAWTWMKNKFNDEAAFGKKYSRGPRIKRSVLSFVNVSPLSKTSSRILPKAGDVEARQGAAYLWGTPPAGWYDTSAVHSSSSPPPPTPPSKSPYQVSRRPVAYSPLKALGRTDESYSIDAVLARDRAGTDQTQSGLSRELTQSTSRLPGWRETIRQISHGIQYHKTSTSDDQGAIDQADETSADEDNGEGAVNRSATGFRIPSSGDVYRRVSCSKDVPPVYPVRRSTTRDHRPKDTGPGKTLSKHTSMMALETGNQNAGLQRKTTVKVVEQPRRNTEASANILSRSPSKYPKSDELSVYTVDSETKAVLQHLDAATPSLETPESEGIIKFDQPTATPQVDSGQRLQRQNTVTSVSSTGQEGRRERLKRAETIIQNAAQRVAAHDGLDFGSLRRAVTTASATRASQDLHVKRTVPSASGSARDSRSSSTTSSASRLRASQSMYNTARRTLITETPEVPQLHSVLSDHGSAKFPYSRAEMLNRNVSQRSSAKSEYSLDESPPSLVHGSASSSDAEDEAPEPSSTLPLDMMDTTLTAKDGKSPRKDAKALERDIGISQTNSVSIYRSTVDADPVPRDAMPCLAKLNGHALKLDLQSPTIPESASARSSPNRRSELQPKKSILKNGGAQSVSDGAQSSTREQKADIAEDERLHCVALFDQPVGWREKQACLQRGQSVTEAQTPLKKRSWKQKNGSWIASEGDEIEDDNTSPSRRSQKSSEQTFSPPPLPSPPPKAATTPLRADTGISIGDRSLDARLMRTLSATETTATSTFGKHAELFFSPSLGHSQPSAEKSNCTTPRKSSSNRAPTTRTLITQKRDLSAADIVRPQLQGSNASSSSTETSESIWSPSASTYVAPTPTAADALISLAFSPTPSEVGNARSRLIHGLDEDIDSEYQPGRQVSPSRSSPNRRNALNRARSAARSPGRQSANSTDLHYRSNQNLVSPSSHTVERSGKIMTKSSMTLASQYSAVAESTYSSNQEALSEAEERGRVGLDNALSTAWKTRAGEGH